MSTTLKNSTASASIDDTTTSNCLNASQTHFYPIQKSVSVPDIHKSPDGMAQANTLSKPTSGANVTRPTELNNLLLTNSGSIESTIADSPAGSLELNANTPLSADDQTDSIADTLRESQNNSNNSSFSSNLHNSNGTKQFDSNSPSFRFRRHSSQSAINVNSSLPCGSTSNLSSTNERICSSPINSLKMSSRVCQIKIDEGIEPHLSREIKSEREMQNTLKLKSSCDELMLNNDDLSLEQFSFDNNRTAIESNRTNSPNSAVISSVSSFRQNSQSNMPSPSMSSCYSYSNSSSPTAGLSANNNPGLLRCFSPSTTLINNSTNNTTVNQNYFSQSPSPTRKLFVTRRSMSPIQLRPSSLSGIGSNNSNLNKRKLSDLDPSESSQISLCSPKRSNNDNQEFVQPLQIFTGNNSTLPRPIGSVRSSTSSPFSSLAATPSSPNQSSIASLIITSSETKQDLAKIASSNLKTSSSFKKANSNEFPKLETTNTATANDSSATGSKFLWPTTIVQSLNNNINPTTITNNKNEENNSNNNSSNKYTFKPIQLPPPTSNSMPQRKRLLNTTSANTFQSLAQLNQTNGNNSNNNNNNNNSPMNSPAYYCDSPVSSPSVSIISSSLAGEKPDSGYQSSIQNNSDSESCI